MTKSDNASREFLRHTVATLAYRGGKTLRDAPKDFATFRIGPSSRMPLEILAHVNDLFDWALQLAKEGKHIFNESSPASWEEAADYFAEVLTRFDAYLASDAPLGFPAEQLFQGPVADALTHIGQISMLRRLAGAAVRGENYFKADIVAGRVGKEQSKPRVEFD